MRQLRTRRGALFDLGALAETAVPFYQEHAGRRRADQLPKCGERFLKGSLARQLLGAPTLEVCLGLNQREIVEYERHVAPLLAQPS